MLFAFVDVETTGLSPDNNCITQIACVVMDPMTKEVKGKFSSFVRPDRFDNIEEEVLKLCGVTIEELQKYPDSQTVYKDFLLFICQFVNIAHLDNRIMLCGYNINFDKNFLRSFFEKNGNKRFLGYFFNETVDVMCLAFLYCFNKGISPKNMKLGTICELLKIDLSKDKAHTALNDLLATIKMFFKLSNSCTFQ